MESRGTNNGSRKDAAVTRRGIRSKSCLISLSLTAPVNGLFLPALFAGKKEYLSTVLVDYLPKRHYMICSISVQNSKVPRKYNLYFLNQIAILLPLALRHLPHLDFYLFPLKQR